MNPTIPQDKQQKAQQIRRDREAWEAKGNEIKKIPASGQATDKTVNEGERYAE